MGHYTTGTDVYQLLLDLNVGPPSRFPEAYVEPIITGLEAQIDGILKAQGYATVPATDPDDVQMLGQMIRKKAAVQVYLTLNQPVRSPDWCRSWDIDYSDFLSALRKGEMRLPAQDPEAAGASEVSILSLRVIPRAWDD